MIMIVSQMLEIRENTSPLAPAPPDAFCQKKAKKKGREKSRFSKEQDHRASWIPLYFSN